MKIALCVFLIVACVCFGCAIASNLKKKKVFWEDIVKLCETLASNIGFGQKKLEEIVYDYKDSCGEICKKVLLNFIESKEDFVDLKLGDDFLQQEERKLLIEFFSKIGELDVYSELAKIDNYKLRFLKIYDEYCEKNKKLSPLTIKLSIIVGIMICLLFI